MVEVKEFLNQKLYEALRYVIFFKEVISNAYIFKLHFSCIPGLYIEEVLLHLSGLW